MFFKPEVLFERVKKMSYPRLTGTSGEARAVADVSEMLKHSGFEAASISRHECTISQFYGKWFVPIITGSFACIFLGMLGAGLSDNLQLQLAVFILFWLAVVIVFKKRNGLRWRKQPLVIANMYTTIPAAGIKRGTILLSCHLDSKGQTYPLFMRVLLFTIAAACGIVFLGLFLADVILNIMGVAPVIYVKVIEQIVGWLSFLALCILSGNRVNNISSGAADNATGVALVMELARYFKHNDGLAHYDLVCAFFNAEELGVLGSAQWLEDNKEKCAGEETYLFNFDMVGTYPLTYMRTAGFIKQKNAHAFASFVERVATEMQIKLERFWVPIGALTDAAPFRKAGWAVCDMVSKDLAAVAHTKKDVPENIDGTVLADACMLVKECITKIDKGEIRM